MDKFGVYYMLTREAAIFTNMENELINSFETKDEAQLHCDILNFHGQLDELHDGYSVRPILGKEEASC